MSREQVDAVCTYMSNHRNQLSDIYEFGVYQGNSLERIRDRCAELGVEYNGLYGFDSFAGLPDEKEGLGKFGGFSKGYFSDTHLEEVSRLVPTAILIPGFYSESLKDQLVSKHGMKPAKFIYVDCDLYISAYQALDFMFRNGLVKAGTLIGYDEFDSSPGAGEELAHREILTKYGCKVELLLQSNNGFQQNTYKVL